MSTLKKILFFLSIAGFLCSSCIHIFSVAEVEGVDNASLERFLGPYFFLVLAGAVVVRVMRSFKDPIKFRNAPGWLFAMGVACFVYGIATGWIYSKGFGTFAADGMYGIKNHGYIVRTLTAEEYSHYRYFEVRVFSVFSMMFYIAVIVLTYPFKSK